MSEGHGADVSAEALAQFTQYVRFISQDTAQNRQRFYRLSWHEMLDGDRALVCTWGRRGTAGQSRTIVYPERAQVQEHLVRLITRCLHRGYHGTDWR